MKGSLMFLGKRKTLGLMVLAMLFVVVGVTSAKAGTILFSDDFSSGASSLWQPKVGNWVVENGVYYENQYGRYSGNPGNWTYLNLPSALPDNFTLSVDIGNLCDGGIYLRTDSSHSNGILLVTGGWGHTGTGLYWHEFYNGNATGAVNRVEGNPAQGASGTLTIEVAGNVYAASWNGELITTLTAESPYNFLGGSIGLYSWSSQTFDNVALTTSAPVPLPSAFLLLAPGLAGLAAMRRKLGKD